MLETLLFTEVNGHRIHPLRAEQYAQLVESGAFAEGERVELLNGLLVVMEPDVESGEHIWITQRIMKRLVIALMARPFAVICQSSVRMTDHSVPMPDVVVVPKQVGFASPRGGLLVVEVARSSMRKDREVKAPIYSVAQVPEYWIVDIEQERVMVFSDPHGESYRMVEVVARTGVARSVGLGIEIAVDELFRAGD
jgi:Uma2 family endonuclease